MTVMDDTIRGLTLADPDGPLRYIETLDQEVPTYIDPRTDLFPPEHAEMVSKTYKRLDYHVPFALRGDFKPEDWPEAFRLKMGKSVRVSSDGFVLCHSPKNDGGQCGNKAVNRTVFCRNHGAALHPADKKVSSQSIVVPEDRVAKMTRIQQFFQGFLKPEDLNDDEIQGGFVRDDHGVPVKARALGVKFEAAIAKELHARLNRFLQSKTASMLQVMVDIAENDLYEAADRVKAAIWVSERTLGKTPDVVLTGNTTAAYQSIIEGIESGSREDYRKSIESFRVQDEEPMDVTEVPVEVETERNGDFGSNGMDSASESRTDDDGECDDESGDAGEVESSQDRATRIEDERTARLEFSKRQRKAKMRRFAARAVGATSLSNQPWLCEFKPIRGSTEYRVRLVSPDQQTPGVIERILSERSWEEPTLDGLNRRRAQAADEEAAALRAKIARLGQVSSRQE